MVLHFITSCHYHKKLKKGDSNLNKMKPNTHKHILKACTVAEQDTHHRNVINVSRSVGTSGDWIGCGLIDKTGTQKDVTDYRFPFFSLVYVVTGKGQYIDENSKSYYLGDGSLFQRKPGVIHSTIINPELVWTEYYIDLSPGLYNKLSAIGLIDEATPVYHIAPDQTIIAEFKRMIRLLCESSENRLPDVFLKFLALIRDLVNQSNLQQVNSTSNKMIEKGCIDFNRMLDQRFDVKEYCKENGWGYESFRKLFKKNIGLSPVQYIVRRRLEEACRLLRTTTMQVSEISTVLGYQSQYDFSNQFNRQFGVFPKQFREGVKDIRAGKLSP